MMQKQIWLEGGQQEFYYQAVFYTTRFMCQGAIKPLKPAEL